MGTNERTVTLGNLMFSFDSYPQWVNKAASWFTNSIRHRKTTCIDQKGRICTTGREFMRARDDGSFPIDVYLTHPEDNDDLTTH